ncbi:hypothetical protein BgiBS90_019252 [Biomphalaria glabrata]|nr:hypothetical protein BgiBS90_019252 [Biomphalaria glabrata]
MFGKLPIDEKCRSDQKDYHQRTMVETCPMKFLFVVVLIIAIILLILDVIVYNTSSFIIVVNVEEKKLILIANFTSSSTTRKELILINKETTFNGDSIYEVGLNGTGVDNIDNSSFTHEG